MADSNTSGEQNPGEQKPGAGGDNTQQKPTDGAPADKGVGQKQGEGEKTYSFKEDRSDWVPRHRLNETSGKLTEAEKRAIKAEADLEQERKRTRALAGVETPSEEEAEAEKIKGVLYKMFPQLETLEGLTKEQLQEVLDAARSAKTASRSTWERHATTMLNDLDSEASEILGVDKLSDSQQTRLRRAYRDEAVLAMQDRKAAYERGERNTLDTIASDNDFVARHERGDKALIKEFVKAFLDDFYEPARRSVTAAQVRRQTRPVPRGERTRQSLTQGPPQIDYNNDDAFKKALIAARGSE